MSRESSRKNRISRIDLKVTKIFPLEDELSSDFCGIVEVLLAGILVSGGVDLLASIEELQVPENIPERMAFSARVLPESEHLRRARFVKGKVVPHQKQCRAQ